MRLLSFLSLRGISGQIAALVVASIVTIHLIIAGTFLIHRPDQIDPSAGHRQSQLAALVQLLGAAGTPPTEQDKSGAGNASDLWLCPKCAGPMVVVERLTAAEIQLRSPPLVTAAA